jgi:hypothetical protein
LIGDDDENGDDGVLCAVKEKCQEIVADNRKLFIGISVTADHSGRAI